MRAAESLVGSGLALLDGLLCSKHTAADNFKS